MLIKKKGSTKITFVALVLQNAPRVSALMTATVNPSTNLVYYYGGIMVDTSAQPHSIKLNAVTREILLIFITIC